MGRFDFKSPGASMADGLRSYIMEREMERRQAVAEAEQAERMKLAQAADARAAASATQNAETVRLQQEAAKTALARGQRQDVLSRAATVGVGGDIPAMLEADMAKHAPELMDRAPATFDQGAQTGVDENDVPLYMDTKQTAPERNVYKGTPAERVFKELQDNPNMTARDILLKLKAAGEDLSAGDARILAGETDTDAPAIGSFEDYVVRKYGDKPTAEQIKTAREEYRLEEREGQQQRGFTYATPSALGTEIVDGPTGKTIRVVPSRLNEGSQLALRASVDALNTSSNIRQNLNPDKVGVVAGRLARLDQKLWGSDPQYAEFARDLEALANMVIQARTGAQMSVQEAERIKAEVASGTLPITTFVARLDRLEQQLRETIANITTIGTGQLTPDQLRNLANPDVPLSGAGTNMVPGGGAPPAATPPATTTPPAIRWGRDANGRPIQIKGN